MEEAPECEYEKGEVAPHNFINARPECYEFSVESSKSGKDRARLKDPRTDWDVTVELAKFEVLWEKASGDGTLGHFGILDARQANYTMTLVAKTPSAFACIAFIREACAACGADSVPYTADTLKVKRRLCKWTKEGEVPKRDPIPVYGVSRDIARGDTVRPTVQITPWFHGGIIGVSLNLLNVVLLPAAPAVPPKSPEHRRAAPVDMTIPDLPDLPTEATTRHHRLNPSPRVTYHADIAPASSFPGMSYVEFHDFLHVRVCVPVRDLVSMRVGADSSRDIAFIRMEHARFKEFPLARLRNFGSFICGTAKNHEAALPSV